MDIEEEMERARALKDWAALEEISKRLFYDMLLAPLLFVIVVASILYETYS